MAGLLVASRSLYPEPLGDLFVQHPDLFVGDLIDRYPQQVLQAVETILARLKNPPQTFGRHLETLADRGLPISVALL